MNTHEVPRNVIFNMTSSGPTDENITDKLGVPEGCAVVPFSKLTPWNNPEDLVSYETAQRFKTVLDVYLLTAFFFLSVPLNIVNMVVFWRHGIRERINLCLFFLALADCIVIASHFEWQLDRLYAAVSNTPHQLVIYKANINNMVHSLGGYIYISGFMTTLIAFERCLCIVSPLRSHSIIQLNTTTGIIVAGHVIIFGGHFVAATRWRVVCMFDPFIGQSRDVIYSSQFYFQHKRLVDILDGVLLGILFPGFYVIGVSVSTIVTVIKLRQMKEWRDKSSSIVSGGTASKDITLTRMLIATNILFVACTTPPLVFHAVLPFLPELSLSGKYYNTYYVLITMQQLLTFVNSSVNFFFYYFFGTKFRQTVQHMFCTWCGRENKQ